MGAVLLPIVGLLITITLIIIFSSKKHIRNKETTIYFRLLILNLIFIVIGLVTFIIAKTTSDLLLIEIFQKLYMGTLILLNFQSIKYCLSIFNIDIKRFRIINLALVVITILSILLIFILPLKVIYYDDVLDGEGPSYIVAVIYSFASFMIFLVLTFYQLSRHNNITKIVPFLVLILLYLIGFMLRSWHRELIFEGFFYSYILLIMFNTIENPDVKMLNEMILAKEQAEKSNKVKSDFLSSMSHEIRTPLNAISGYSQLINETEDINEIKEYSKEIVDSTNILLHMFSNIIDVYELESKDIKINNKDYDFYTEIDNLLDLYEDRAIAKKLLLFREINPSIPKMYGDVNIIKKILVNILDNAIYYTDTGNITVKVETTIEKEKCILKISISDTGCGIKPEHIKNLFQDFERGIYKNSAKNGAGLGLSISKRLVELLNGQLEIKSEVNKGTIVKITLNQKLSELEEKNESINS